VIGRAASVDGRPATIAAVLPGNYHPQLQTFDVIVDLDTVEPGADRMLRVDPPPQAITAMTAVRVYQAIGEVKANVTIDQARAEIEAIHAREQRDHPTPFGTTSVVVTRLQDKEDGGRTFSASRRVMVTGRAMVAVQVALTIVLLAGAGLMFTSVWRMTRCWCWRRSASMASSPMRSRNGRAKSAFAWRSARSGGTSCA
jgi:hypothetical protein